MVRFSIPNLYTNYRPNCHYYLRPGAKLNTTLTTNTDPNPNPYTNRHRRPVLNLMLGYSND